MLLEYSLKRTQTFGSLRPALDPGYHAAKDPVQSLDLPIQNQKYCESAPGYQKLCALWVSLTGARFEANIPSRLLEINNRMY